MSDLRKRLLKPRQVAIAAAALVSAPLAVSAAQGGDLASSQVRRGERLAEEQCSACHIVAQNQEYPPLLRNPAPSFQSIANRPATNEKSLRHFVTTTHWDLKTVPVTMPNPELSKADTTAVIRYILSLQSR